jgi:arylsulfatase A-like enzyme
VNTVLRAAALALLLAGCGLACGRDPIDANLLLVTLDTTRPDHLGCYGYERDTSPSLDRLAADALVYTRAFSTSSWTLPAHASLFTGMFPSSHGARIDPHGPLILADALRNADHLRHYRASGLSPGQVTLAEILGAHGFATAAVIGGPWMKRLFGLDRGFQHYDERKISTLKGRSAADVTDGALEWLDARGDERFFLFLNYYDPHAPYEDPEGHGNRFLPPGAERPGKGKPVTRRVLEALYDGEIRYMDEHFGRLLESLRARGLYDDTWIIVGADHGELLGEHSDVGHGRTLYQEEIRVPLIVKFPAGTGRSGRDDAPIQLTDVFALVLEGFGIPLPPEVREADGRRPVFAEVYPLEVIGQRGDWRVLLAGDLKFHWNSRGNHLLFDLGEDPGEANSLAQSDPERVQRMERELEGFLAGLPKPMPQGEVREVDEETRRALRNLGYLE